MPITSKQLDECQHLMALMFMAILIVQIVEDRAANVRCCCMTIFVLQRVVSRAEAAAIGIGAALGSDVFKRDRKVQV